mgnify:CR=1 FL=1
MRAIVCREYGTPEDLVLDELPDPTAGPGQVVVRVRAAAVNYPDVLLIAGKYQIKVPPPFTPGSEMAGDVLAVSDGVDLRPGDRVSATAFVGGFAEQILVDARGLTPIPDGVDYADAAAFGVTNRTAYYTLRTVAPVRPDDWVVVLGAAGLLKPCHARADPPLERADMHTAEAGSDRRGCARLNVFRDLDDDRVRQFRDEQSVRWVLDAFPAPSRRRC